MITLERFCYAPAQGVFGRLTVGAFTCFTVEREWRDNQVNISCLPEATYRLEPFESPRFGSTFVLTHDVLGVTRQQLPHSRRWTCIIHPGNTGEHVRGCIAPGDSLTAFNHAWGVKNSYATYSALLAAIKTGGEQFIEIKHYRTGPGDDVQVAGTERHG